MEKKVKVLKNGFQIVLVMFLLSACSGFFRNEQPKSKQSKNIDTSSNTELKELERSTLTDFKRSITELHNDLKKISAEQVDVTANVSTVIKSYRKLGSTKTFLDDSEQEVFDALKDIGEINYRENTKKIKALQQALIDTGLPDLNPGDPSIYGKKTNDALIKFLVKVENKVDLLESPSRSEIESDQATPSLVSTKEADPTPNQNRKMPFEIIPSLLGLFVLSVLGGLAFWIWKLGQKVVELHGDQRKLHSEIQAINQSLQRKENRAISQQTEVQQLTQRLNNQENTFNAFAQEKRRADTINSQSLEDQQISRGTPHTQERKVQETQTYVSQSQQVPTQNEPPKYLRLVKQYNQSPNSLAAHAAGVSQTEESLKQNLQDSSQTSVVLAQDNSPNYWIVRDESDDLWLFPKEGWEPSIGTLESFVKLFSFTGNPSRSFRMIKPASVVETGQRDWILRVPGEIEFS